MTRMVSTLAVLWILGATPIPARAAGPLAAVHSAGFASVQKAPGSRGLSWRLDDDGDSLSQRIGAVPEPAAMLLLGIGLAALARQLRRRKTP